MTNTRPEVRKAVRDLVLEHAAAGGETRVEDAASAPVWRKVRDLGTRLWLDTGSLEDARPLWCREFSALTTNNTLLNKEIQKGTYDKLILEAHRLLAGFNLEREEELLEVAFILNARHGLKLVRVFDAFVSVEEHTSLAHNVEAAVEVAQRYVELCPERFIVKIPLTPAGLLATRRLSDEGIPVNHTLGFSARQNVMITRFAKPRYVNVFLGRLNSFVADNGLGSGQGVGEKAAKASQAAVRSLRASPDAETLQIGASLRSGDQVAELAGLDVLTMPPAAAGEFLGRDLQPGELRDRTGEAVDLGLDPEVDADALRLDSLWQVGPVLHRALDALCREDPGDLSPDDLVRVMREHGVGDLVVPWSDRQIARSAEEGKIPQLRHWRNVLAEGKAGLDSLMNLAGLNAFRADQNAMDEHVAAVLQEA